MAKRRTTSGTDERGRPRSPRKQTTKRRAIRSTRRTSTAAKRETAEQRKRQHVRRRRAAKRKQHRRRAALGRTVTGGPRSKPGRAGETAGTRRPRGGTPRVRRRGGRR